MEKVKKERQIFVACKVSPDEKKLLWYRANKAGLNMNDYVRRKLFGYIVRDDPERPQIQALFDILNELRQHRTNPEGEAAYKEYLSEIRPLLKEYIEKVHKPS